MCNVELIRESFFIGRFVSGYCINAPLSQDKLVDILLDL